LLQFTKLRLTGFKSFVDGTELPIEPGLTGVVGPNGCGKSNVVEALRWVMGESSAKQMRGGEMDDIIFAGTENRPARNIAEVLLGLDNSARTAPAQFNDMEDLEVTRRINRGSGSTYRVNGKEVRARDVQLLFADSATGARSTALVSQGRVGALIAAKPVERRALLEEAAGITGLHSRRHEAELRLRGAETNLTRLDDALVVMESQLQSLKKQARQATRYRNLSDHIRRAEATVFFLRWMVLRQEREAAGEGLRVAEARVAELTGRVAAATTAQAEASAGVPALRDAEAAAAAELQRLNVARDGLEAEAERIEAAQRDCRTRLEQVVTDSEREKGLAADAAAAMGRLETDRLEIERERQGEEAARTEAAERLAVATTEVAELDSRLAALTEEVAADEASRKSLERRIAELTDRRRRLSARADEMKRQHQALAAEAVDAGVLEAAEEAVAEARAHMEETRGRVETAEGARLAGAERASLAVTALQAAEADMTRLEAEEEALVRILQAGDSELWPALIDAVTVEPGLEGALGAALGDDLLVPADDRAPAHWLALGPLAHTPPLPAGAEPLSRFVRAPAALARRLSQVGVVADEAEGGHLRHQLVQGQRLVSRDGALWRWDGFTVGTGASAAAARLEQRNRLDEIRGRRAETEAKVAGAGEMAADARAAADAAAAEERATRLASREADSAYARIRDSQAELKERGARHQSRLIALTESAEGVAVDLADTDARVGEAAETLAALPDVGAARDRLGALRQELTERRAHLAECRGAHDSLLREAEGRRHRLADMARELDLWRQRNAGAGQRLEELEERRRTVSGELEKLAARPGEIDEQRRRLLDAVEGAEGKRGAAADRLAQAEQRLTDADRGLRAAEGELAQAREERVRAEGAMEQAEQAGRAIVERVTEQLGCAPEQLGEVAGLAEEDGLPDEEAVERKLDRLLRERDTMGPVNLRADHEARELGEQMDTLQDERGDLIKAIEKLRQGIAELNREGRQRLLASFNDVDRHFQDLFVRLFGGGRARLQLTESDDPLEAGLEIMGSPPGKRLQMLSLMSGGEQALTALALLFAVFLTNPAPICVLDEVDAPLDDANVDRFCSLLEEISESGNTRFLIITHHHMTMARVDRLFGVTMSERGVSQLVSVDLSRAEELRATA
jgi:chromosome segregation protein